MNNKPRKWWLAGLLSLIEPGLGQIYNGQARKGILFILAQLLLIPLLMLSLNSGYVLMYLSIMMILTVAYYVVVVGDAIRHAKIQASDYQLKKYNKTIIYLGVIIVLMGFGTSARLFIKNHYVEAFKIPAGSMEPTILIGDHILVDRQSSARSPQRGDLVIFEYPKDPSKDFIKRVVAVGGDTVAIRDKQLYVNNKPVKEAYIVHNELETIPADLNPRDNFGPLTVPADSYFMMGDNRDRSYDSRFWGCVEKSRIKGTVRNIYWSWDRNRNAVRWNRIGTKFL